MTAEAGHYPTVAAIVAGFALVCGLFILRAIHKLYDQGIRHEGLLKAVQDIAAKLDGVIHRFDLHCGEEERWQAEAAEKAVRAQSHTQTTISEVEMRLTDKIEMLTKLVYERRAEPRKE